MANLKLVVVPVVTLVAGYFGHRLTGNWLGTGICAGFAGLTVLKLLEGNFIFASVSLLAGMVALFQSIAGSGPDIPDISPLKGSVAAGAPSGELFAAVPNRPASGAVPMPKEAAVKGPKEAEPAAAKDAALSDPAAKPGKTFKDCAHCPEMVAMPKGDFLMGSATEGPQHKVAVPRFALGQDAVTKGQFATFVQATHYQTDAERLGGCFALTGDQWGFKPELNWRKPGFAQTDSHPAVCISWNDAQTYADWLRSTTQHNYRLPTEAEREYATRAGTDSAYWWGDDITPEQANYHFLPSEVHNSKTGKGASKAVWHKATVPILSYAPNAFGLHNLHGNVLEWVQDCQHDDYKGAPTDGTIWMTGCVGTKRGVRGGSWATPAPVLRSTQRTWFEPGLPSHAGGFRVARDIKPN